MEFNKKPQMEDIRILIADDDDSIRFVLQKLLEKDGFSVDAAKNGRETLERYQAQTYTVVFLDIIMPDANGLDLINELKDIDPNSSIIIITAHGDTQTAIEAAKRHSYDYVTKPFDRQEIIDITNRAIEASTQARSTVRDQKDGKESTSVQQSSDKSRIVGQSTAMRKVFQTVGRAAVSDETVLIIGESGTGKELVAKAIHENSDRDGSDFIVVDCSAIPPNLMESALFGHVKGAFTGADQTHQGKFEQAHQGTIFLDEVGELPHEVQMKLLRVLQEREIEPIGSGRRQKVDVRVVSATNRHLDQEVRKGSFRQDLFYRLNVIPIYLPPLRERLEDIPALVDLFVSRFAENYGQPKVPISDKVMEILVQHSWSGNVRELENSIKRALVMGSGNALLPEHFSDFEAAVTFGTGIDFDLQNAVQQLVSHQVEQYLDEKETDLELGNLYSEIRRAYEKPLFEAVLDYTEGNRSRAAQVLGINRNTLHSRIQELSIHK